MNCDAVIFLVVLVSFAGIMLGRAAYLSSKKADQLSELLDDEAAKKRSYSAENIYLLKTVAGVMKAFSGIDEMVLDKEASIRLKTFIQTFESLSLAMMYKDRVGPFLLGVRFHSVNDDVLRAMHSGPSAQAIGAILVNEAKFVAAEIGRQDSRAFKVEHADELQQLLRDF